VVEAQAVDLFGEYDYLITPNGGNNYENAWMIGLGVRHDISGDLDGKLMGKHITDVTFPCVEDTQKGAWGEMRAYGVTYGLVYDMPYNEKFTVTLGAEAGYWLWDFKEFQYLQDNGVTVDMDNSFSLAGTIGLDYKLNDKWNLIVSTGWFSTKVGKNAHNAKDGVWHILDSGNEVGLEYVPVRIEARTKF
jgi:hypothetical protein